MIVRDGMSLHMRLLVTGLTTFTLMGFGQGLIGPALAEMSRTFGLKDGSAGFLVSAQWVGSGIGVAVMYLWGQRITPRIAGMLIALGAAGLSAQLSWASVLLSATIFGFGYGMATTVYNPMFLRVFASRGPSMLSLLNASYAFGAIISPLAFVALGNSSSQAFGFAAVAYFLIALFSKNGNAEPGIAPTASSAKRGFRPHWPVLCFAAIGVGLEACLAGLGPTALMKAGESEEVAAQLLSAFFVVFLLARLVLGAIAHRFRQFDLFTMALVVAVAASILAIAGAPGIGFAVLGISAGVFFPTIFVTGAQKMGDDPRVTPVIIGAGLTGGIGLPILVSGLTASMGPMGFFWVVLALSGPTAFAALFSRARMNR